MDIIRYVSLLSIGLGDGLPGAPSRVRRFVKLYGEDHTVRDMGTATREHLRQRPYSLEGMGERQVPERSGSRRDKRCRGARGHPRHFDT